MLATISFFLLMLKYILYPTHTVFDRNAPRAWEGSTLTNGASSRKTGLYGKSRGWRPSGAWQGNMLQAGAGERPPRGCSLSWVFKNAYYVRWKWLEGCFGIRGPLSKKETVLVRAGDRWTANLVMVYGDRAGTATSPDKTVESQEGHAYVCHSFIQQTFTEHWLCTRHHTKCLGIGQGQNKAPVLIKLIILA